MTGLDLGTAPRGVDGCGIPVIGIPLANMALAMARLGRPDDQPEARPSACARFRQAMAAHPVMAAAGPRFATRLRAVPGEKERTNTGAGDAHGPGFPALGHTLP